MVEILKLKRANEEALNILDEKREEILSIIDSFVEEVIKCTQ